ncbi:Glycerol-3-phosphate dehydrogenase [Elusimicrobium minutum Pei191]|uniref:Glycerol-3-phosphate dehydrogenase [NAD(P)+] n=1 Tax=Elusimicrobium minutum (strain Pei191) TaxID=445932 RepID=B2KDR6_ELUMP|nr:NAD(P)H-dependent glycerol-3-phosphate dehydrogenase [Elusimicrobium minutum]ACC98662.1 Glycerol-3-phosphate dehydrogenase [Elusimicrobium minutum Pei191]
MNINRITVFGAGVWGSVIAQHLAKKGYKISLWEHYKDLFDILEKTRKHPNIENFELNSNIELKATLEEAVKDSEMLVFVISSKSVRNFCKQLKPILNGKVLPVVSASKGIEDSTFKTVCEVIEEEIPQLTGYAMSFSGPSFALEVAKGIPTKILVAGPNADLVKKTAKVFNSSPIITVESDDRRGVEYGGAIKNVVAIGCGILDGIGDGADTKAALITQAMQEMHDITVSQGGKTESVYNLSGLGDAILTGMSSISRNRRLGEKLGQGLSLEEARKQVGTIAEGADSVNSVHNLARKNNLKTPILDAVWQIVCNGEDKDVLLKALGF